MLARRLRHNQSLLFPLLGASRVAGEQSAAACSASSSGRGLEADEGLPWLLRLHRQRQLSTGGPQPGPEDSEWAEDPQRAAIRLTDKLSPAQRAVLASTLTDRTTTQQLDEKYWEELFRVHDAEGDSNLSRSEFQAAMKAHQSLTENRAKVPPSSAALRMVFLAAAIPFVAFGFLDNAIMLVAGEEIDHMFGLRLGLSTLASAGLGNAVADVIGVGAAKYIEQAVRWLPFVKEPKLNKYQNAMPATQRAKLAGAMLGVFCGCMLGLTPLFLSGSFFTAR